MGMQPWSEVDADTINKMWGGLRLGEEGQGGDKSKSQDFVIIIIF